VAFSIFLSLNIPNKHFVEEIKFPHLTLTLSFGRLQTPDRDVGNEAESSSKNGIGKENPDGKQDEEEDSGEELDNSWGSITL